MQDQHLNGVVQGRLVLDVNGVDVDLADVDQELDQLRTLDGVDEASSSEVVGTVHVGSCSNQALHDVLEFIKRNINICIIIMVA